SPSSSSKGSSVRVRAGPPAPPLRTGSFQARTRPPQHEAQEQGNGPPARYPTIGREAPPPQPSVSPVSSHTYGTPCWTPTSTVGTLLPSLVALPPARTDPPPPTVAIDPRRIRPHRTVGTPPPRTTAPLPIGLGTVTPSAETATTTTPGPVRTGRTALPPPPRVRTTAPSGTIPMVHDPTGHRNSTPKAAVTTTLPVNGV